MSQAQYAGTGRRKNAVLRVRLVPGTGKSLLTKMMLKSTVPHVTFVLSSTSHSQLLQLWVHTTFTLTL